MNSPSGPHTGRVDLLFDARHIHQSGIGTYIGKQLVLLQDAVAKRGLSLAVLVDPDTAPSLREDTAIIPAHPSPAPMYSIGEQKAWDYAIRQVRPRAVWLPHYPFPFALFRRPNRRILTFVTVHDTIHLLKKSISGQSFARRMYARTMLNIDARRCTEIFTASAATTEALQHVARSAPLTVAAHPVDPIWLTPVDLTLSPVQGKYIVYVGNDQPHKNLPLLLDAYREIVGAIPHKLVIAGGGKSVRTHDGRIQPVLQELGDSVVVTGRLRFDELRALVAAADLLVMPSLVEGVGMPPLEAMAARTAVVSSDIPSLRETCGDDGADYFDPHDQHGLAHLIRDYCLDDDARTALADRGWTWVTERQSRLSFTTAVDAICSILATDRNTGS
ncbi:glycosyltransferase family 1 protein [soil metagenome]